MTDPLRDTHVRADSAATLNDSSFAPTTSDLKTPIAAPLAVSGSPIIPEEHPFRTLVLCFDGTGDQFDADNSNIVQLFSMLKKDDRSKQMVYYQAGIGTYTSTQVITPFASTISKAIDEAVAWNLDAHVMGGYEFLMQNYTAGDRICIFGFSRGAYTARSLAGMIHKVGLLPACNHQQVPFAYKMYTQADPAGWAQSNAFKKSFSIDVDIEFIGVWDTVDSVGLIPRRLPFTTSNTIVRTFRHAVSLDEHRAKFKANLWNRPNVHEQILSVTDQKIEQQKQQTQDPGKKDTGKKPAAGGSKKQHDPQYVAQRKFEEEYSKDRTVPTDVEEVWFAGCHCDVGGGSVSNEVKRNLARISLRWMIRECFKTKSGIMFHTEGLKSIYLDPNSLYPIVAPRPPPLPTTTLSNLSTYIIPETDTAIKSPDVAALIQDPTLQTEEGQDLLDALCPVYDQLSLAWTWWVLEIIPLRFRYQNKDNSWGSYLGMNWGKGRYIPKQKSNGVKVHRSVKTRMDAHEMFGSKYEPKANLDLSRVTWVD
ncbi:hypothetical protein BDN72DRAFT_965473 [Pluteus cervinus]|uniref:Uncharacterized protein n=1 Tax=Pluteus cervinus TaxID=181527 RepID=A0ACD3A7T8_9AGAR|nr:hypothetical protein BDN72DRAFT_965473 [Pluteus cervinus]